MFYNNVYAQEEKDAVESLPLEEFKSTTSRDKPSSLNTQLYSAENFMKFSSPRRGCYMYNGNNKICNNGLMEVEEEAHNANSLTNLSQNYHQTINNSSNNTSSNITSLKDYNMLNFRPYSAKEVAMHIPHRAIKWPSHIKDKKRKRNTVEQVNKKMKYLQ